MGQKKKATILFRYPLRYIKKFLQWVNGPFERWFTLTIIVLVVILFILGPVLKIITLYPGYAAGSQNRLYLLSAIAQSLAAILALVVTITLVSVQLASQTYTPHVMHMKLRDKYFWTLIILYVLTILYTFWAMSSLKAYHWNPHADRWVIAICLLLTSTSVLFLFPYIAETIKSLKPDIFVGKLLKRHDSDAVEEVLHRAANEGFITIVNEVCVLIDGYTLRRMLSLPEEKRPECAGEVATCYRNVAKRAFRKKEQDAFYAVFRHLRILTKLCTDFQLRAEADVFNDTIVELYDFALEEKEQAHESR